MPDDSFRADRERVFALHGERRYAEALTIAEAASTRHPDHPAETSLWRACLLCRTGRTEEALDALLTAAADGVWWSRAWLEKDPDLDPLRPLPGFGEVLARSDANLAVGRSGFPERPEVRLHVPAGPPRCLVLVMHMLGSTAAATEPHWLPAVGLGAAVAVAGSTQSTSDGQPCWELDDLTVRDLSLAREEAIRAGVDAGTPLVLAGASQGGQRAIELAIDGRMPASGFLAIVPGVPRSDRVAPHLDGAVRRGVHGWILTGEHDQEAAAAERLHRELGDAGLAVRFELVADLGHDYPQDVPAWLPGALAFVLADAPS